MKQKSQNRFLAALLAVAMMLQMLPMLAFAEDAAGTKKPDVAWIGKTGYKSLQAAVEAASSDATTTIKLGEGVYSLGDTHKVTDKSLTFVGAGTDKTTWQIQAPQAPYGADGYCDYSFDGSDSITFQDMTVIGSVYPDGTIKAEDTQGLVRVQNITLKDCVFNGRADYWGYTSTTFDNVTFNAPGTAKSGISSTNYSLWTYTGKTYTFRDCTFNSKGKTISVYRHVDPGYDVTVNFENCTVNSNFALSALFSKTALSIGDHTFGSSKYILNIINPHVTAARDNFTCSQVFGFGDNSGKNTGRTDVYLNGDLVWTGGKKLTHSYADGEKEKDGYRIDGYSDWTPSGAERIDKREVTKKCKYCGWTKKEWEYASVYRLQYNLNEGVGAENVDYSDANYRQNESVTLKAAPTREGYQFAGWLSQNGKLYKAESELKKLTGDEVFTAQWKKDEPVVNHTLTVTGGTFAVKDGDIDVTNTLETSTDEASGKQTCLVPDGAEVTVTLDQTKVPEGMVFDLWSTGKFDLPQEQDYKAESITFTMNDDVDVAAQYRSADIEDGSDVVGPIIVGTAVVAGGALVGYTLGTDLVGQMWGLPYFPSNRSALAMMLWEDAGKPMPESEILYPDVGQEEQDMDLQHAARWAMEHDLLPDLNDQDTELPPEQVKFYPDNMVTKIGVLRAWKKAQDLKQNAQ